MSAPTVTHLYQVPVGPGGQETDSAELIFPDDLTDTDTSPALAPDQCTLFFSRVDDSGAGTVQIYAALRD